MVPHAEYNGGVHHCGRRRESEPVMSSKRVRQNAAKAIVWLTVAMFAHPATPASACNCATGITASGCECCCQRNQNQALSGHHSTPGLHACCSRSGNTTYARCHHSTSQCSDHCTCGSSCSCKSGQPPAQPIDPLTPQEDSPSKVGGGASQASLSTPSAILTVRSLVAGNPERIICGSSLERCISLSRFTL
jgi:hypothetical protein